MDLQMEPLDGIESTRRVRARYDDVEVVALTSFDDVHRVKAALEAGASGYLLKTRTWARSPSRSAQRIAVSFSSILRSRKARRVAARAARARAHLA
jgi:DNA-binding NarL/FixJ family response regulator